MMESAQGLRRSVIHLEPSAGFSRPEVRAVHAMLEGHGDHDGSTPRLTDQALQQEAISLRLAASMPHPDPRDALLTCAERDRIWAEQARIQRAARRNPLLADLADPAWPPLDLPPHLHPA